MNLPKHIEERAYHQIEQLLTNFKNGATYSDSIESINNVIAQILQERDERLVGKIQRMIDENSHINNYYNTAKEIINIIEDSHEQ